MVRSRIILIGTGQPVTLGDFDLAEIPLEGDTVADVQTGDVYTVDSKVLYYNAVLNLPKVGLYVTKFKTK